jgi:asparagine synthase (glutamine-hydrolysing)
MSSSTRGATLDFVAAPANLADLSRALSLPATAQPAEVLLKGWHAWQAGLFGRLEGGLAIAIRDGETLHLYRDPSGLAALYWGPGGTAGKLYATSLGPLHRRAGPTHAPSLDRAALHEYLRLLDLAPPRTILCGVQALAPGQWVRVDGSRPPVAAAVHLDALARPRRFAAAVDELDRALSRSVRSAVAGHRRTGAFLSGGVDSGLICATAARVAPDLTALTVAFEGAAFDETPVATRVAGHLGIAHEVLRFSRDDYLLAFGRLARSMDQPMADPATMATLLAFEHCRERFDVVLDGTGADEAVGAMPPRHVRLAVGLGSLVPGGLRRRLVGAMSGISRLAGYTPILDFEHPAETLMRWKGFTRAEIEELCSEPVSLEHATFYRTFTRFPRRAHFERYTALLGVMPGDRLTQAMRLSGLHLRLPFSARDVDGFLRQLPTHWRHSPGQPKRILRELLARYVPRSIWDHAKHGFDFPLHDFLAGERFALVEQHVLEGRWLGRGLLRPEVVRRYAQAYIGGDRRLMFRVWALVVLGAWLDAHENLSIPPPGA